MTQLNILGPAEIRNSKGELEHSFLAGPKRLALLTFLLLDRPRGFHRRDSLLPLFWPEQDQKSARNALSNMLYHIRKTLGKEALKNRGAEEVMIDPQTFVSDATLFENAIKRKDFETALPVYRSELLKGFFVNNISPEFDHWLEKERSRFHSLASEGSMKLADDFIQKEDHQNAVKWLKKSIELNPDSEALYSKLIKSYLSGGMKKAALEAYQNYTQYLRNEYHEEPNPEISTLINAATANKSTKLNGSKVDFRPSSKKSIAVLPFEDLSFTKLHFAEGIQGDILTALVRIKNLKVISRTSVKNFLNTKKAASEIGRELNTTWLLEGEVQQAAGKIRINIRLIHAPSDSQVWSQKYQHELTAENIFLIRDEVTNDILKTLEIRLTPREKSRKIQIPTENLEAYRLYTLGRSNLDLRTEEGIYRGLDYFKGSIELDPQYALAWAGMADALSLLKYYGLPIPKNSMTPVAVASKAVELDGSLGEGHCALGIAYSGEQNGPAAIRELELAISLSPSYAEAYIWLGWVNIMIGRPSQGTVPGEKAVKFNPLAPAFRIFLSIIYLANKKYREALAEARRAREINPDYMLTHYVEGLALYHLKNFEEALSSFQKILPTAPPMGTPSKAEVQTVMAFCYHALEEKEWGQNLKEEIHARINPFSLAMLQALTGELSAAFQSLERVQDWGSFSCEKIRYLFPKVLSDLRRDKRFSGLIRKVDEAWSLEFHNPVKKVPSKKEIYE